MNTPNAIRFAAACTAVAITSSLFSGVVALTNQPGARETMAMIAQTKIEAARQTLASNTDAERD